MSEREEEKQKSPTDSPDTASHSPFFVWDRNFGSVFLSLEGQTEMATPDERWGEGGEELKQLEAGLQFDLGDHTQLLTNFMRSLEFNDGNPGVEEPREASRDAKNGSGTVGRMVGKASGVDGGSETGGGGAHPNHSPTNNNAVSVAKTPTTMQPPFYCYLLYVPHNMAIAYYNTSPTPTNCSNRSSGGVMVTEQPSQLKHLHEGARCNKKGLERYKRIARKTCNSKKGAIEAPPKPPPKPRGPYNKKKKRKKTKVAASSGPETGSKSTPGCGEDGSVQPKAGDMKKAPKDPDTKLDGSLPGHLSADELSRMHDQEQEDGDEMEDATLPESEQPAAKRSRKDTIRNASGGND